MALFILNNQKRNGFKKALRQKLSEELLEQRPSRKKYKKEEQTILKACLDFLRLKGCVVFRNNAGVVFVEEKGRRRAIRMGTPGAPDIIGCAPGGIFIAIECKTKNGRVSQKQKDFLENIKNLGGFSLIVRNVEGLIEEFNKRFK